MQLREDVERVGPSAADARGCSGVRRPIRAALVVAVAASVLCTMGRNVRPDLADPRGEGNLASKLHGGLSKGGVKTCTKQEIVLEVRR